jgi:3'-5' exoribonuclease 1
MACYIVFDLEATCWEDKDTEDGYVPIQSDLDSLNAMEVIEIGAVALGSSNRELYGYPTPLLILDEYNSFVKPTLHPTLSKFCTELTSITQRDVNLADPIEIVLPQFIDWARKFDGEAIFVSWGMFDKAIFERMVKKQGKELDITYLTKNHFSAKHRAQKVGLPGKGLGNTLKKLKIPFEGRQHRGIDDARMIAKIFNEYFDHIVTNYKVVQNEQNI